MLSSNDLWVCCKWKTDFPPGSCCKNKKLQNLVVRGEDQDGEEGSLDEDEQMLKVEEPVGMIKLLLSLLSRLAFTAHNKGTTLSEKLL